MLISRSFITASILGIFLSACANQPISSETNTTIPPNTTKQTDVFVGKVTSIENGKDGSTVLLSNETTGELLDAVISIPNLGPESKFDFDHIKTGNILKVYGKSFELNNRQRIAGKVAKSYVPVFLKNKRATATEQSLCESLGGTIKKAGISQFDKCVQTYSDAGDICQDASDCFGRCVIDGSAEALTIGETISGICEMDNDPFGCTPLVTDGKYEGTICID